MARAKLAMVSTYATSNMVLLLVVAIVRRVCEEYVCSGCEVHENSAGAPTLASRVRGKRAKGLELRRRVRGRGRAGARRAVPGTGGPPGHVGRVRPPSRRDREGVARQRRHPPGQARALPLQLSRV